MKTFARMYLIRLYWSASDIPNSITKSSPAKKMEQLKSCLKTLSLTLCFVRLPRTKYSRKIISLKIVAYLQELTKKRIYSTSLKFQEIHKWMSINLTSVPSRKNTSTLSIVMQNQREIIGDTTSLWIHGYSLNHFLMMSKLYKRWKQGIMGGRKNVMHAAISAVLSTALVLSLFIRSKC